MLLDRTVRWCNEGTSNHRLLMDIQTTAAWVEDFQCFAHELPSSFWRTTRGARKTDNIPARAHSMTGVATLFSTERTRISFQIGLSCTSWSRPRLVVSPPIVIHFHSRL